MEVKVITDVTTEPVTLAEVKDYCQIDADYSAKDSILNLYITAAREKLEKELNLSFAPKTLMLQWDGSHLDIPYGPVSEIDSLHPSNDETVNTEYDSYGMDFKSIWIPSASDCYVFIPVSASKNNSYNLTYNAGYEELPKLLKQALLIQIDWDIKNEGIPVSELSPIAMQKAKSYSKNLFIQ